MTAKNLTDVKNEAERAYEFINDLISHHSLDMMDLAYPEHDAAFAERKKHEERITGLENKVDKISDMLSSFLSEFKK